MSVDAVGDEPRVGVVLCEPRDIVLERIQTRRCDHAGLAHAPAETLAPPPHLVDGSRVARNDGPDRRAEPLADADGDRVALVNELGGRDTERDGGVEQPCSVAVNAEFPAGERRGAAAWIRSTPMAPPPLRLCVFSMHSSVETG